MYYVQKCHQHSAKRLTEPIHTEGSVKIAVAKVTDCYISIFGLLKTLCVSRLDVDPFLIERSPKRSRQKVCGTKSLKSLNLSPFTPILSIPAPIEPPDRSLRATIPAAQSHYSGGGNHHSGN